MHPCQNAPPDLDALLKQLSPAIIIERARAIEAIRADGPELAVFHGFAEPLLHSTPYEWLAAVIARHHGVFAFDRLDRTFLPTPPTWVAPEFGPAYYNVTRGSEAIHAPPLWPFGHDLPVADHTSTSQARWFTHGLVHALIGAGLWSDITEWELMAQARLSEAIAAIHWYNLSELGRLGDGDFPLDLTDLRGDEAMRYAQIAHRALEPETRLSRLDENASVAIAENLIETLRYEVYAFRASLHLGELIEPEGTYLGLGEACEYARVHVRRINDPSHARWREACLQPGVDFAASAEAFEARAAAVLHDFFFRPLEELVATPDSTVLERRFRRVLMDLGQRLCHADVLGSAGATSFEIPLGLISALLSEQIISSRPIALASIVDAIVTASEGSPSASADILAVGYAPLPHEPEPAAFLDARMAARLRRTRAWHPAIGNTFAAMPAILERSLSVPMSRLWLDHTVTLSENLAREGVVTWEGWGYLGWLSVATSLWRDGQAVEPGSRWHYRLAHRTLPADRGRWARFEIIWNPYLQRIPMPYDARWDEETRRNPPPARPAGHRFKPRPALALWYCLIGTGRSGPVYLPLTPRLNGLINRLKRTARLDVIAADPDFGPDFVAEALASEAVLLVERPVFDLPERPIDYLEIALSAAATVEQRREDEGPWADEDQALAYADFCRRSTLYRDTSDALCDAADLPRSGFIGELGFGTGETTMAILRRLDTDGRVVAVDPALRLVSSIFDHVNDHRARFVPGAARSLLHIAVTSRPFDRVVANSSVTLAADIGDEFAHVFAMLAPGGRFAFSIPAEYLGFVEHMTTANMVEAITAIASARTELELAPPTSERARVERALGSLDAMFGVLHQCGFINVGHVLFKRPWPASEYFDWLAMPVVRKGMVAKGQEHASMALVDRARALVNPDLALESAWYLIVATRPDTGDKAS